MYGYDYGYDYYDYGYETATGILGGFAIFFIILFLISIAIGIIQIIAMWKLFKKAGKGGWEALIPGYNIWVLYEISGLNWWWFLITLSPIIISFIPILNLLALFAFMAMIFGIFNCYYNIAKKFNKGTGFAVCLTLFTPICVCILGFSKNCVYNNVPVSNNGVFGPSGNTNNNMNNNNYNNMNNNYNNNNYNNMNNNYNNMNNNYNNNNYNNMNNGYNNVNSNDINSSVQPVNNNNENDINNTVTTEVPVTNDINNETVNNNEVVAEFVFCGNCGTKLSKDTKFCPNCGKQNM